MSRFQDLNPYHTRVLAMFLAPIAFASPFSTPLQTPNGPIPHSSSGARHPIIANNPRIDMQKGVIAGSPLSGDLIRSQIIWILRDLVYEWFSGGGGI